MAKKTAPAAPAETPAVPKKTNQTIPSLPCALMYFWAYAIKAWENCKANLPRFTAESGRFTETFVDDQITYIKAVKALPGNRSRLAVPRAVRLALIAARQEVMQKADQLANAIDYTFKDKLLVDVELSAAGVITFKAAKKADWAAVSSFITTANTYIGANLTRMVDAGAVNAGFSTAFESVGTAFDNIWNELLIKRQKAKDGTKDVAAGIVNIQKELNPMLSDALNYFKYEPDLRVLFVQEALIAQVQSGHPASVSGGTMLPPPNPDVKKGKPLAGVLVEVLGVEGKTATTNKNGRYKIQLSGGDFVLRFSGAGLVPVEQQVKLAAGKGHRLNMVLVPVPAVVVEAKEATPPPPPASMNEVLNKAMQDVKTNANGESATSNGQMASQNGHAVA